MDRFDEKVFCIRQGNKQMDEVAEERLDYIGLFMGKNNKFCLIKV